MQRALCYDDFAILHSGETKTPVFVAQRLSRQSLAHKGLRRTDKFFADARLPSRERAELGDYKGSGFSRGHMAPAGDMASPNGMAQSFSLANVVPQNQQHNAGPWARIEHNTRQYALRATGDVYVITGPVFAPNSPRIGARQVRVPSHLFKLVYDPQTRKAWAHWSENRPGVRVARPISYQQLVQYTGLVFLPGLVP